MVRENPETARARARLAFAEFLESGDAFDRVAFGRFCREHRELARDLVHLRRRLLGADPAETLSAGLVSTVFGDSADPRVDLEGDDSRDDEKTLGRLERLTTRVGDDGGRYVMRERIAQGGMGTIHRVWDSDLRRHLAMKVMRGQFEPESSPRQSDSRAVARFLEEAQITGQLDHPGIVPVHELGVDAKGRVFFTMRMVKGKELREIFDMVRFGIDGWSQTRVLAIIFKICEAMAYAHSKGVIHRDLKPSNVMVGRFGATYVMDWGLARVRGREDSKDIRPRSQSSQSVVHTDRQVTRESDPESPIITMDGNVLGTPAYMAPEQASGDIDRVGPASDVYSVGAILYHHLTQRMPYFDGDEQVHAIDVLTRVLEGPPKPILEIVPRTPPELVAICEKAMARDPERRYRQMHAMAEDLRAYLEGRVVRAYEAGAFAEVRKWVARNQSVATAAAALFLVLLLGPIAWISNKRSEDLSTSLEDMKVAREDAETERKRAESFSDQLSTKNAQLNEQMTQVEASREKAKDAAERMQGALLEKDRINHELEAKQLELEGKQGELEGAEARASGQAKRAEENEQEALRQKAETELLNEELVLNNDSLVRARFLSESVPNDAVSLRSWMERAADLVTRERSHQETADRLLAGAELGSGEPVWRDERAARRHASYAKYFENLAALPSLEDRMKVAEGRIVLADTIQMRTIVDASANARWRSAIDSIASIQECPWYGGLILTPQIGLLPIGQDKDTGFWEFAHIQSGQMPSRDRGGRLHLAKDACVVLVLLPGGSFSMGADESSDPLALPNEQPVVEVTLDPFFLSKYEMTQAQWEFVTGQNPSQVVPGTQVADRKVTALHPVETITWTEADRVLRDLDLQLPTEAQWEYATRAGGSDPWPTGTKPWSLEGRANLADRLSRRRGAGPNWPWQDWDDPFVFHGPVYHFPPNRFGLYGMLGNVAEWCVDVESSYAVKPSGADGQRTPTVFSGSLSRAIRGGNYKEGSDGARSAVRGFVSMRMADSGLGVRPARGVTTR